MLTSAIILATFVIAGAHLTRHRLAQGPLHFLPAGLYAITTWVVGTLFLAVNTAGVASPLPVEIKHLLVAGVIALIAGLVLRSRRRSQHVSYPQVEGLR